MPFGGTYDDDSQVVRLFALLRTFAFAWQFTPIAPAFSRSLPVISNGGPVWSGRWSE